MRRVTARLAVFEDMQSPAAGRAELRRWGATAGSDARVKLVQSWPEAMLWYRAARWEKAGMHKGGPGATHGGAWPGRGLGCGSAVGATQRLGPACLLLQPAAPFGG